MSSYKIKSILNDSIVIEYKLSNGFTKELIVNIDNTWDKARIEEEIAKQKVIQDQKEIEVNFDQYFSVGEELQFVDVTPGETFEEINKKFEEEQKLIQEENDRLKSGITPEYAHINPPVEEQLDALYWMRQGDMGPIERVDRIISEIKAQSYQEE
jgi:hypothetical protein